MLINGKWVYVIAIFCVSFLLLKFTIGEHRLVHMEARNYWKAYSPLPPFLSTVCIITYKISSSDRGNGCAEDSGGGDCYNHIHK